MNTCRRFFLFLFAALTIFTAPAVGAEGKNPALVPKLPPKSLAGQQGTNIQPLNQMQGAPAIVDIRDIHGPVLLPQPKQLLLPIAIGSLALLALVLIILFIKKRKPSAPVLPAHEIAFADLAKAKAWIKKNKGMVYAQHLSEILRQYVEARFLVRSTRQTTDELLTQLQQEASFVDELEPTLHDLQACLERCDMAKFAHLAPDYKAMEEMESMAHHIIETTRPVPTEGERA